MKKPLTELSLEELNARKKTLVSVVIAFGIIMIIACAAMAFLVFKSKKYGLIGVMPALFISLLPVSIQLTQVNAEIKKRF